MARKREYDDELMVDAVFQYAENYSGIITYADLARYVNAQKIAGLEGITAKDFSRPLKDEHSGKIVARPARIEIESINDRRNKCVKTDEGVTDAIGALNEFWTLDDYEQKVCIRALKNEFNKMKRNAKYAKETLSSYKNANIQLVKENEELKEKLKKKTASYKEIRILKKKLDLLSQAYTDEQCNQILEKEGYSEDGSLSLVKYRQFLDNVDTSIMHDSDSYTDMILGALDE